MASLRELAHFHSKTAQNSYRSPIVITRRMQRKGTSSNKTLSGSGVNMNQLHRAWESKSCSAEGKGRHERVQRILGFDLNTRRLYRTTT